MECLVETTLMPSVPVQSDAAVPKTVRAAFAPPCPLAAAQKYTRELALGHYENFSVVSWLLPRELRQDFCNIYAFCRTADDLGDEVSDKNAALDYLYRFGQYTESCFTGDCRSPLFVALAETIKRFDIPIQPFLDLIDAFEQDQRMNRYDDFEQLVDYCRRSADPVGRLVLYMCGYRDEQRQHLSDRTCTALQLANFWQDVRRDIVDRDRIYIPRDSMEKFGVSEAQIRQGRCDENYRRLIRFEVDRTERMFDEGDALLPLLAPVHRRHISLFAKGGRAILQAIRRQKYDTLSRRPSLSRMQKGKLMIGVIVATIVAKLGGRARA